MNTNDEHIAKDKSEIAAALEAGDASEVRHLEGEIKDLEEYKAHHPGDNHDPTPLEVFCDLNPDAPETEFIVVVNGSRDRTEEVAREYARRYPRLRVLVDPRPIGKGGAVMMGFAEARARG